MLFSQIGEIDNICYNVCIGEFLPDHNIVRIGIMLGSVVSNPDLEEVRLVKSQVGTDIRKFRNKISIGFVSLLACISCRKPL